MADQPKFVTETFSGRVTVSLGGTLLAETTRAVILREGNLPPRYYIPEADIQVPLEPSDLTTRCPWKGTAGYHSVTVDGTTHADIVWTYGDPIPEAMAIKGLHCFFDEKVDLSVDGKRQPRPVTKWSTQ
ncbi:MAG: DUF427 domain-containing protein [Pseudomonadota bacterium]|nr:DUF427 domain-containing protein [Pseudomonadota bacterium]